MAASRTHGRSFQHTRPQPPSHTVAACSTYGGSLQHIRLQVKTIEGIFSGTLSYLFNEYKPGMKFSDVRAYTYAIHACVDAYTCFAPARGHMHVHVYEHPSAQVITGHMHVYVHRVHSHCMCTGDHGRQEQGLH